MEALAREAKVSTGLVYVYFKDRTEVLLALLAREFEYLVQEAPRVIAQAETLADKIVASFRFYLDAMELRGPIFHMLVGEASVDVEIERKRAAGEDTRTRFWQHTVAAELDVDPTTALLIADQFLAAGTSLVNRWLRDEVTRAEVEDTFFAYLRGGLSAFGRTGGNPRRRPAQR